MSWDFKGSLDGKWSVDYFVFEHYIICNLSTQIDVFALVQCESENMGAVLDVEKNKRLQ